MIVYSKVVEPPIREPVEISEAKAWLKIDGADEDPIINTLIIVARQICESYANMSFITQQREVKLDRFSHSFQGDSWHRGVIYGNNSIELPYGPVTSIDDFTYINSDGDSVPLVESTDFYADLNSEIARLTPVSSWPTAKFIKNAITITYTAGYNDANGADFPYIIKQAVLQQVASLYENRQDEVSGGVSMIGWSSQRLLDTIKVYGNANA